MTGWKLGSLVVVLLLAATAGFAAGGGRAASINSCPNGDCLTVFILPGTVSAGEQGVAVAEFKNLGPATANHVTVTFGASGSTLLAISSDVRGAVCDANGCDVGSIRGFGSARVFAVFRGDQTGSLTATLRFDEGNGTSPTTDTFSKSRGIVVSSAGDVVGDCLFRTDPGLTGTSSDGTQLVTIEFAQPAGGLPCAPVDASIGATAPAGFTEKVVTVDLLFDPAGKTVGTVVLDFATLPNGFNYRKFVLREIVGDPNADPLQTVVVGPCGGDGLPQTTDSSLSTDSCVFLREKYPKNGAELTLHVFATGLDPGYVG